MIAGSLGYEITIGNQTARIDGKTTAPARTWGTGDGLDVLLTLGTTPSEEEDPRQDVVNVATNKIFDLANLGADYATETITDTQKKLVNVDIIRSTSVSGFTTTVGSTVGDVFVGAARINGDLAGLVPVVNAEAMTTTVQSYTTDELASSFVATDDRVVNYAKSELENLVVSIPVGLTVVEILRVDSVISEARAVATVRT